MTVPGGGPQARIARWNPVGAVLSALGLCALVAMPFLRVAPNRMLSGEPVYFWGAMRSPAGAGNVLASPLATAPATTFAPALFSVLFLGLLLALLVLPFAPLKRSVLWLQAVIATAVVVAWVALAGWQASQLVRPDLPFARTSLGGAFWALLVVLWLMATDAMQRLKAGLAVRMTLLAAAVITISLLLAQGACDDLSIMKEYANRSDVFAAAIARHVQIVVLALLPTLCIGVPLGWWTSRHSAAGQALFPVLNVIQTIPSIALFGLLMAPLALLAAAWPWLARAGISGVGMAPGVIALTLYSLLPVVRGTLAGFQAVPSAVVDAARGMGLLPRQIFTQVEVPLALPVLLAGVRTATIQAVGLATVTALIGAGGLGAIMFEGLFSSAPDLVLLGVLPVIALAVAVDAFFKLLIRLTP
jgi:osmoprotectant transport system permease protein